eukprot:NODE_986_length_1776_cov_24.541401_g870_i0.p2 GENE.NODE_986_length_1776_cov_24.541401_g870_i0~~NODE_986_length_1776_cov_24.541401_g870_i0.p2  ORF type:complete len:100 (+),score=18.92 NODE_986_length_1776_cov_24.541401_g870_i0:72-371(+)
MSVTNFEVQKSQEIHREKVKLSLEKLPNKYDCDELHEAADSKECWLSGSEWTLGECRSLHFSIIRYFCEDEIIAKASLASAVDSLRQTPGLFGVESKKS